MPGLKRRGLETERQTGVTVTGVAQPTGKPAEHEGPRTYHTGEATAPVSDPTKRSRGLITWWSQRGVADEERARACRS
jgi:hypothetical protein